MARDAVRARLVRVLHAELHVVHAARAERGEALA
jgi:hypothetical protein